VCLRACLPACLPARGFDLQLFFVDCLLKHPSCHKVNQLAVTHQHQKRQTIQTTNIEYVTRSMCMPTPPCPPHTSNLTYLSATDSFNMVHVYRKYNFFGPLGSLIKVSKSKCMGVL
jgi:hypothetical protein